jgi:hypothetical protein
MVVVDLHTSFTWLVPLAEKTALTIARSLWTIFSRFGVPRVLQSDQPQEFTAEVVKRFCAALHIDRRLSSAYHPRANGKVERHVGVCATLLHKLVQGRPHDWHLHVPFIELSINLKRREALGATPFSLMFGRAHNGFADFNDTKCASDLDQDRRLWQAKLAMLNNSVRPAVVARVAKAHEQASRHHADRHRLVSEGAFPSGALVYARSAYRDTKFDPVYDGPFIVDSVDTFGSYRLRDHDGLVSRAFPPHFIKLVDPRPAKDPFAELGTVKEIISAEQLTDGTYQYWARWADGAHSWVREADFLDTAIVTRFWRECATPSL